MPLTYQFRDGIVEVVSEGQHDFEHLLEVSQRALQELSITPPVPVLVDARRTERDPGAAELSAIAEHLGALRPFFGPTIAIVVSSDLHFGLGRMFEVLARTHGIEARVYRDMDAARAWIAREGTGSSA